MIKLQFTTAQILTDNHLNSKLVIELPKSYNKQELHDMLNDDKQKVAEIKYYRKKRSLDANAALWLLLDAMAKKLLTTSEELYERAIKQYGVSKVIGVAPEAVDDMIKYGVAKYVTRVDSRIIGDKKVIYLKLHFGSSTYDTAEMSFLLGMVAQDAKDMGIELISKSERELIMKEWG